MHNNSNKFCHPAHDGQHQHAAPAEATTSATTAVSQHKEQQQQKHMAGTCKHILVHRTAAYNSVVWLQYIRSRYSVVKAHTRFLTMFFLTIRTKSKGKARRDLYPQLRFLRECNLLLNQPFTKIKFLRLKSLGVPPARVRKDEHGEARRANTTPNDGPHLELLIERLRLKTWSKSDLLIAETWYTYIYGRPPARPTVIIVIILCIIVIILW